MRIPLLTIDNPEENILRTPLQWDPEDEPDREMLTVGKILRRAVRHHHAYGVAAPQIGHQLPIFATMIYTDQPVVKFNPKIKLIGDLVTSPEMCLSIPGKKFNVERFDRIELTYWEWRNGFKRETVEFEGLFALVFQHEMDHLNGTLIDEIGVEVK